MLTPNQPGMLTISSVLPGDWQKNDLGPDAKKPPSPTLTGELISISRAGEWIEPKSPTLTGDEKFSLRIAESKTVSPAA
jgi:hypothetical protein